METFEFLLSPFDNRRMANLCGQLNEHLKQVEERLGIELRQRGDRFSIRGEHGAVKVAQQVLDILYRSTSTEELSPEKVHLVIQESGFEEAPGDRQNTPADSQLDIRCRRVRVRPRGERQIQYVSSIRDRDLTFGVGPAGTGKTYLAVACAVEALEQEEVRRLILVRPAVEAGERLGFLPGDLTQKIDPYLRPIYDALYEMLGFDRVAKLIDRNVIEVAPLAFMRGRTLNNSFIILDEAQNTTIEQMKMFLTRFGYGSKVVVTGDMTQIDLPKHTFSGLKHALTILQGMESIGSVSLHSRDVFRHPLVKSIVNAYEKNEQSVE